MNRILVSLVVAVGFAIPVAAETVEDQPCDHDCQIEAVDNSQSVVIYHTRGQLSDSMADALLNAVRRKVRVEIFVGEPNEAFANSKTFMNGFFMTWNMVADDTDTSLLGMGACILDETDVPPFLVTDPFGWSDEDNPVLVESGQLRGTPKAVSAFSTETSPSDFAKKIETREEFIQCKLG